jgi:membrane associated rhomboid family serine protease
VFGARRASVPLMLSDRPYMRDDYRREKTSFLVWLLSAIVAGFLVYAVSTRWFDMAGIERLVSFSANSLEHGRFWTLLSYPFLHRGPLHVLGVGLALFFIGRELAGQLTEKRFALLALAATVLAGLAWLAIHFNRGDDLVGAAPILWCYFTVYACFYPSREISFLIFFVFPVTTRPKYVLWGLLGIDVAGLLLSELPQRTWIETGIPYSAHLAGILVGWVYWRFLHNATWRSFGSRAEMELPRWMKRTKKAATPVYHVNVGGGTRDDIRAEVDRVLDKINSHGFGSLTPEEKRVLDNAKDLLSRR